MRTSPQRRRILGGILSAILTMGILTLVQSPSRADEPVVHLSGDVEYGNYSGIPDVSVRIYKASSEGGSPWTLVDTVHTQGGELEPRPDCWKNCSGRWETTVTPGSYRVTFNEMDDGGTAWQDWASLDLVAANGPSGLIVIDGSEPSVWAPEVKLDHFGGAVVGRLRDQCNEPVEDVTIEAFVADGAPSQPFYMGKTGSLGEWGSRTLRDPTKIKLTGPPEVPGTIWLPGATNMEDAQAYTSQPNTQYVPQIVMNRKVFEQPPSGEPNPRIRGVLQSPDGQPVRGVPVRFYRKTGDPSEPWHLEATAVTGDGYADAARQGSYLASVPVGEYRMTANEFEDGSAVAKTWAPFFYKGTSFETSGAFCATVLSDQVEIPTQTLDFGGRAISGRLTDPRGMPISGATVETYAATAPAEGTPTPERTTKTNANGEYTTHGTGGPVKLRFVKSTTSLPEWFNDTSTFETAAEIASDEGPASTGNDAVLADAQMTSTKAPVISGTPNYGRTVSRVAGRYSPHPVKLTYQWMRRTSTLTPITGERSTTYKVRTTDIGKRLVLRETATPVGNYPGVKPIIRYSPYTERVKRNTTLSTSAWYSSGTIKVRVTVKVAGVAHPNGTVVVRLQKYKSNGYRDGSQKSKTVTFRDGKATVSFKGSRGIYSWNARYAGTTTVAVGYDSGRGALF